MEDDKYDYFCLVEFDTEVKDPACIFRRGKESATLEFCNQYRRWTENPDLRRGFLCGDNALEKIDQAFAFKKVKERQ